MLKSGSRCALCLLPKPCRHHERELYRAELSETALEKEIERDQKREEIKKKRGQTFSLREQILGTENTMDGHIHT
jgi:hypothetical protein